MGAAEEAGKTAQTIIEALKQTPAVLALVLFNLAFMATIAWTSHKNHERWDRESQRWEQLVEKTLAACRQGYTPRLGITVPAKSGGSNGA